MTPEGKIQRQIRDELDKRGLFYWRSQPFNKHGRSVEKRLLGIPDILLLHKGHLYGLEVKTPTGEPSKEQLAWGRQIEANGGQFYVVRSVEDVLKALGDKL